jgi:branched-subunit amino acid ABC-type transport system permease component
VRIVSDLLPFVIIGIASGSLYGLAGIGLVLTFKTTGVFNFGHGAIAALAAYFFYDVHVSAGVPWPLALLICVVGIGVGAGLLLELLGRRLGEARAVLGVVATVGILLLTQGFLTVRYGAGTLGFPPFLPTGSVRFAGIGVTYEQMIIAATGLAVAAGLLVFFRRSRLGMAMRAVVDDPSLLSLAGVTPARVRRAAWVIGCGFAALTGVLFAPSLGRDPIGLTLLVVQAFGAAAIGMFASLPLTYAGGLAVGVASALATYAVASHPSLNGLPPSIPFMILVVALLVTPARRLAVRAPRVVSRAAAVTRTWPARRTLGTGAFAVLVVLALPHLVGAKLPVFLNAAVLVPMFLSLALLVWTSGQISLCHAAFVAFGATTFSHLSALGLPWPAALLLAGLATVPLGAVVAIPAIRLSGIYLALATFGFGLVVQGILYTSPLMFGEGGFRSAPRPSWWFLHGGDDTAFFLVVCAIAAACIVAVALVRSSRLGRLLQALGDSPTALTALGADTTVLRFLVFSIAAFLAGLAGALSISASSQVSIATFGLQESLLWVTVLAICGSGLVSSPLLAALAVAVVPAYLPDAWVRYEPIAFGAAAALAAVALDHTYALGRRGAGRLRRSPVLTRVVPRPTEVTT